LAQVTISHTPLICSSLSSVHQEPSPTPFIPDQLGNGPLDLHHPQYPLSLLVDSPSTHRLHPSIQSSLRPQMSNTSRPSTTVDPSRPSIPLSYVINNPLSRYQVVFHPSVITPPHSSFPVSHHSHPQPSISETYQAHSSRRYGNLNCTVNLRFPALWQKDPSSRR
jgi:hypothetical protein